MKVLQLAMVLILLVGCKSVLVKDVHDSSVKEEVVLNPIQRFYLWQYTVYRKMVTDSLGLSPSVSADNALPSIAMALGMPSSSSWEDLLDNVWIRGIFTEERHKRFSSMFCGRSDATWIEIGYRVESLKDSL